MSELSQKNLIKMCFDYFGILSDEDILEILIEFYDTSLKDKATLNKSMPSIVGLNGLESFGYHLMLGGRTYVSLGFYDDGTVNQEGYQDGYYLETSIYDANLDKHLYIFTEPTKLVSILRKYKMTRIGLM